MILVDTSVWIDHFRRADQELTELLTDGQVLGHPAVVGEVGLGSLANRREILRLMSNLPQTVRATHAEVMSYIESHPLSGQGVGYVDAHLLASTALTTGSSLWTRDRRLHAAASALALLDARD